VGCAVAGYLVAWRSTLHPLPLRVAVLIAACMGENACMKKSGVHIFEMTGLFLQNCWLTIEVLWGMSGFTLSAVLHHRHATDKLVEMRYIRTAEQVADIFTRSVSSIGHDRAVEILGTSCCQQKAIQR
jgi:hypothetical protein